MELEVVAVTVAILTKIAKTINPFAIAINAKPVILMPTALAEKISTVRMGNVGIARTMTIGFAQTQRNHIARRTESARNVYWTLIALAYFRMVREYVKVINVTSAIH